MESTRRRPSELGGGLKPVPTSLDETPLIRLLQGLSTPPDTLWVGFSGGLDSTVLLDLAARLRPVVMVRAIHINHQLHSHAARWSAQCEGVCEALGIELTVRKVDASPRPGQSPEEAARIARYRAFYEVVPAHQALMLAHHLDDQAETVLLQLLRGAGAEGLVGMPEAIEVRHRHLLRPLLDVPRGVLLEHAKRRSLRWIEDPSNDDLRYRRNQIRHALIPQLNASWPSATRTLARSGRHLAETATYLRSREDLLAKTVANGRLVHLAALAQLPRFEQKLALRGWFRMNGLRSPSEKQLQELERSLLTAAADRHPQLVIEGKRTLRRYRGTLCLLEAMPAPQPIDWNDPGSRLRLPEDNGWIRLVPHASSGLALSEWHKIGVKVCYRSGGERICLEGQSIHHELGDLCQAAGLPPWIRDRIPLLYATRGRRRLISIGGLWNAAMDEPCEPDATRWIPRWEFPQGIDPLNRLGPLFSERCPEGSDTQ